MSNIYKFNLEWEMSSTFLGEKVVKAELPGDNYYALLQAGIIPDPYYGKNELLMQEIWKHDWVFSQIFDVPEEVLNSEHIYLSMSMIDTFCTCTIKSDFFTF